MRAILVSETNEPNEVQVSSYKDYYKLLNAKQFGVARVKWKDIDIVICMDDYGILKSGNLGRNIKGCSLPLFGNLVICGGVDVKGNPFNLPESITIADVEERISIPLYTIK